jgi:hypothetical protein
MWAFPLSPAKREKELKYILNMARVNGYKEDAIMKLSEKHERKRKWRDFCRLQPIREKKTRKDKDRNGKEIAKNVVIPFYAPLTERLEKNLRRQSLNVCYQSRGNLKEIIGKTKKGRSASEKSGIYEIKCRNCRKRYLGQTKRRKDDTRLKISMISRHILDA